MRTTPTQLHKRGFTIFEFLITAALIAILSTLAIPSFRDQMVRSRRSEAKTMLLQAAMWMERNQTATYRYDRDESGVIVDDAKLIDLGLNQTPTSGTTMYTISFIGGTAARANYVLQAQPTSSQASADKECGQIILAIDHTGQRGRLEGTRITVDTLSEQCWRR
jgi:type IV pilus assembly protein PilE